MELVLSFGRATIILASTFAILAASGCNHGEPAPQPLTPRTSPATGSSTATGSKVDISASTLSRFSRFPVYWAGQEYGDYKLDRIIGPYGKEEEDAVDSIVVLYGTCGSAFETGCVPDLAVKSWHGCLRTVDSQVRERQSHKGAHLEVQAGDAVVTLYAATAELEAKAAQDMMTANPGTAWDIPAVVAGSALPGSLCELQRLHPRIDPTLSPPVAVTTEQAHPATVLASFGDFGVAKTLPEAEQLFGARVVRSNDPRYTLVGLSVAGIRRFKNPLPRLEQMRYTTVGHECAFEIAEEPESYPGIVDPTASVSTERLGNWDVQTREGKEYVEASFFSGDSVAGQPIRVSVVGICGYSIDELRTFVKTLTSTD